MNTTWNLDTLYRGFDDPAFLQDLKNLESLSQGLAEAVEKAPSLSAKEGLTLVLSTYEDYTALCCKLFNYLQLIQCADSKNTSVMKYLTRAEQIDAGNGITMAFMKKYIASLEDIDKLIASDDFLGSCRMIITEIRREAFHMLSPETEAMIGKMNLSAGSAWSKLYDSLTSALKVDYAGDTRTLSQIRALAYDPDAAVRKEAYEAELAAYPKISDSLAYAINSIKKQYAMLSEERGYASVLSETLQGCRMKEETLNAMFDAMKEAFPIFHRFLKAKAALLGHKGSLPFYDLFAPVTGKGKNYDLEETKAYLIEVFSAFSKDSADLIRQAFDEEWIDFYPREGKVGGAFCANLAGFDESRILTNFHGDYNSVDTLAHELGHAYHDRCIADHRILNQDYPMPIAETASTFNETHLSFYTLEHVKSDEEKLSVLEPFLTANTQVICDIYSRFLFEDEVIRRCRKEFLSSDTLCEIMTKAQKAAYGDGLDENFLHPYMWCAKGHYYIAGISYYNFPYAFGNLLALGLYAQYRADPENFPAAYRKLLHATPVMTLEEVAALAGIDLTKKEFWASSLSLLSDFVSEYEKLAGKSV